MTALLKQRTVRVKKAEGMDFPVAQDEVILKGAYVVLNAGYLENATAAASLTPLGRASVDVNNDGGGDGDVTCHVDFMKEKTLFPFIGKDGEFNQSDMGGPAYLEDNQTVTTTNTTRTSAGTALKIETANSIQTVWVEV